MTRRFALLLAASLPLVGACSDRGELISLVQRIALDPGVDALDPTDPTAVGQDWRRIEFFLSEPLIPSSAASFDPSVHLDLDGLSLDPASPPFFNSAPIGTIPPNALLTVTLLPVAEKIPEGTYGVRLISPEEHRLQSDTTKFLGEFRFTVSVVARDGKLPYIVRFRPQEIPGVSDEPTLEEWFVINVFGEGVRPHGERVAPHETIRVEFNERMRTPVPVTGGIPLFTETFIDTSFGRQTVLLQSIAGVNFTATTVPVAWSDSIEGEKLELATVIESSTEEGLEISADYVLDFRGVAPLSSIQGPDQDRSGERLTLRFFDDPVSREIALVDKRGFRTAPIRVNAPDHLSYLNANAFLGGDIVLAAEGEIADFVDVSGSISQVNLTILAPGGGSASATTIAPFTTNEVNLAGVAIDRYQGTLTFPASGPDGVYELRAEAVSASGSSFGRDTIRLLKDTVAPALFNDIELQVRADETEIIGLCVVTSPDTISAELFFGSSSLGTSTTYSQVFPVPILISA